MSVLLDDSYVTVTQAAKLTGYKRDTLYRWLLRNNVEMKRVGQTFVVRLADVQKYEPTRCGRV